LSEEKQAIVEPDQYRGIRVGFLELLCWEIRDLKVW